MAFRGSDSFADECLRSINRHRTKHQVPPLRLNAQISRVALKWAECLARSGELRHNDSAKYNGAELGENIAMRWSSDGKQFSGEDFVDQWYEEVKNYDFRKCSGNKTGHFTQLVWKGSAELGVGKAVGSDGKWMVVANFYPAGNFLGEFQDNVFPPEDGKIILKVSAPSKAPSRVWPDNTADLQCTNATFLQRQVRTERTGRTTKTTVIETFRNPDGSMKTVKSETTSTGKDVDDVGQVARQIGAFQLNNDSHCSGPASRAMPAPSFSSFPSSSSKSPWSTGHVQGGASGTARTDGTSSQATSSGGLSQREFNDEVVRNHNQYRRQHGAVGDLRLNSELCGVAQQWAQRLASGRILKHSGASFRGKPMGENLACKYGTGRVDYTGKEVVKGWYDEIKDFNFRFPDSSNLQAVGHFTQVVWKGSQEIGIGKATSSDGAVFVVCNYIPAGNIVGRFKENVFPAK